MSLTKQFIKELIPGSRYLGLGLGLFLLVSGLWLGLAWVTGYAIDKLFNIEVLQPWNYIVYGSYILIGVVVSNVFMLAILAWILMAYKSAKGKMNG